jgi:hypothetical protein
MNRGGLSRAGCGTETEGGSVCLAGSELGRWVVCRVARRANNVKLRLTF